MTYERDQANRLLEYPTFYIRLLPLLNCVSCELEFGLSLHLIQVICGKDAWWQCLFLNGSTKPQIFCKVMYWTGFWCVVSLRVFGDNSRQQVGMIANTFIQSGYCLYLFVVWIEFRRLYVYFPRTAVYHRSQSYLLFSLTSCLKEKCFKKWKENKIPIKYYLPMWSFMTAWEWNWAYTANSYIFISEGPTLTARDKTVQ